MRPRNILVAILILLILSGTVFFVHGKRIDALREPLAKRLFDPFSAMYDDEMYEGSWFWPSGVYCGKVNSKNKLGAYTGYRRFMILPEGVSLVEGDPGVRVGDMADLCPY